jgi:hypothetical protein
MAHVTGLVGTLAMVMGISGAAVATPVTVYRCPGAAGSVVFQAQPCADGTALAVRPQPPLGEAASANQRPAAGRAVTPPHVSERLQAIARELAALEAERQALRAELLHDLVQIGSPGSATSGQAATPGTGKAWQEQQRLPLRAREVRERRYREELRALQARQRQLERERNQLLTSKDPARGQ